MTDWGPRVVAGLLVLMCGSTLAQEPPDPDPRAKLDFFAGRWTIRGSETTYSETCEWLPSSPQLVCRGEETTEGGIEASLSVFGYVEAEQVYTHTGFGVSPRVLRGWLTEGVWHFTGERVAGVRTTRWQITIRPTPDGFHFLSESSVNGAPWSAGAEVSYVRLP